MRWPSARRESASSSSPLPTVRDAESVGEGSHAFRLARQQKQAFEDRGKRPGRAARRIIRAQEYGVGSGPAVPDPIAGRLGGAACGEAGPPRAIHIPSTLLLTRIFTATRRFWALPSGVSLLASGSALAIPVGVSMR